MSVPRRRDTEPVRDSLEELRGYVFAIAYRMLGRETLSPVERAVFLLHDVFDYPFAEVADIVERSEANCRQIATRARSHIDAREPRFEASSEQRDELARRFVAAITEGDVDGF